MPWLLPRPKVPQAPTIPCRPTATLSDSAALTPAFSPLVAEATGRRWSAARAKPPASRLLGVHREKRSLCFSVVPPRGGRELNRGHRSSKEKNPFTTPNSGWWLPEGGRQVGSQLHPTCTERIPKECRSVAVRQGPGLAWLLELCCFITRAGSLPTAEFLKTGATTSTQRPFWKTGGTGSIPGLGRAHKLHGAAKKKKRKKRRRETSCTQRRRPCEDGGRGQGYAAAVWDIWSHQKPEETRDKFSSRALPACAALLTP
ncbi:uncharacterized protein LOC113907718 [Bos indicus x Bos taurus]|uniref:uncharacterized protein LOC113907718 n=1 Tax=Bos indicus x Bos taurus TaxID=30522 RepID=UPI000F7D32B8|nr:uncharacterized protein LOC113907718 [Bos indicus x Bos taurus]